MSRLVKSFRLIVIYESGNKSKFEFFYTRDIVEEPWRRHMMASHIRQYLLVVVVVCVIILLSYNLPFFCTCTEEPKYGDHLSQKPSPKSVPSLPPSPGPCTCPKGAVILKDQLPKDEYEEMVKRRAKELRQHKARTTTVLSNLLFAAPNSPLQYPIQGFTVQPLTPTHIPGLMLQAERRSSYKVSLNVSKGILTTGKSSEGAVIKGDGEMGLIMESSSLPVLNKLLAAVSYASSNYHIHTGDLALFQFEKYEAVFPITIKQPQVPVLYDMGTEISSHVTIATKTFLRYPKLKVLLSSIRSFYSNIVVIIADDSLKPEKITGDNIQHFIMPPAQGWFAGRNLAVSQVITKYFLWVDDDFVFTKDTKIEKLVEIMEAVPELDVLGGTVNGNRFSFILEYEEGEEMDGGCLNRKSRETYHLLPGFPDCSLSSGVVNFFLARTDAVRKVGFDPKLQRVAHSEFFMDGLGSLMVATCGHVSIGHQPKTNDKDTESYQLYRKPVKSDTGFKLQLHFFKNYLKCIHYR